MTSIPYSVGKTIDGALARVRRLKLVRGGSVVGLVWLLAVTAAMVVDSRTVIFDDRIRLAIAVGIWIVSALAAVPALVIPLLRRPDFVRMARRLDARHPEFEERLSTLVELSRTDAKKAGFSSSLFAMVGDMAEGDVVKVDLKKDFPGRVATTCFCLFAVYFLTLGIGCAVSHDFVGRLFVRAVAPWVDIGNLFAKDITVKPGDIVILSGQVIRISATPTGEAAKGEAAKGEAAKGEAASSPLDKKQSSTVQPPTSNLQPSSPSTIQPPTSNLQPPFSIRLSRKTPHGWSPETTETMYNGVYETTADPNEREWRYRVSGGPAVTRYYYVRVSEMPRYERFTATVRYPDYVKKPPTVISNADVGAIKAIAGTKVSFDLKLPDGDTLADFRIGGEPLWEYTMVSNRTSNWSLQLVNRDGFRADKGRHPLTSFIDQPPSVVIEKPKGTLRLPPHAKIPVEITANDDIGIANVYLRVSIDGEPWANHYGTAIEPPANRPLYRTVADVDLSLYDLVFARNIRFDVVVEDGCPPDLGGPHAVTSTPFTVEFNVNEANYALQALKEQMKYADENLSEAMKRVQDAQRLAREVRDELRRSEKIAEGTEKKNEKLAHELREAEKRVEELRDKFEDDERFAPLVKPMERLEEQMKPLTEETEQAQFRERTERAKALDETLPDLQKAAKDLEDLAARLKDRAKKVDVLEKTKDLADRQEALARAAKDILAERPTDTDKLEAWKRLEEATQRKTEELAKAKKEASPDFDEATRKMGSAIRDMGELKREIEEDKANAKDEKKLAAAQLKRVQEAAARTERELQNALKDQQRAIQALEAAAKAKSEKEIDRLTAQAESAQRTAEDRLENAEATEALKALQKTASTITRNREAPKGETTKGEAAKGEAPKGEAASSPLDKNDPSTLQPPPTPLAAQQAALAATRQELALRQAIAKGEKTSADLRKFDAELREGLLHRAEQRAEAAQREAQAALDAAKAAIGDAEPEEVAPLADAALAAQREAVAAQRDLDELRGDPAAAERLENREHELGQVASAGDEAAAREREILEKQQQALAALEKGDRRKALALQKEVARAQSRAAEAVMGEGEEEAAQARDAANDSQQAATEATQEADAKWNDQSKAEALAAQKKAIEAEQAAQSESATLRALNAISTADSPSPSGESTKGEAASSPLEQNDPSSSSPSSSSASAAAAAMRREVKSQAAALGMNPETANEKSGGGGGKGKEREDDTPSSAGGGVDEEVSKLARELKRNDDTGYFRSLFSRQGWFRIFGLSKDGVSDRELRDIPREYRDLVRRYFLKLSEERP